MPSPRPRPRDRRALSMQRAPGRIERGGEPVLAERLERALAVAGRDQVVIDSLTHPLHTYPARMHPATARALIELFCDRAPRGAVVVDPFCGSGTTLVEARAAGIDALGIDLSPLAVLVARAKTWTVSRQRRDELRETAERIGRTVVTAGRAARRAGGEAPPRRGAKGFDPNARDRRLGPWFLPHVRRELEAIGAEIDAVRATDAELADVLAACLSAILIKVSSRTSDTDPTWIDRKIARGAAARLFAQRALLLAAGLDDLGRTPGHMPRVIEGDARRLGDHVAAGTAWAVITSPPYAGTYDYAEHQRLRFDFLGLRHRAFDEGELGARRMFAGDGTGPRAGDGRRMEGGAEHGDRRADGGGRRPEGGGRRPEGGARRPERSRSSGPARGAPARAARDRGSEDAAWLADYGSVLAAIAEALRPGRYAALVVGDSIAAGRARYALEDVRGALPTTLDVVGWASQARTQLGTAERRAFADRAKAEHIIVVRRAP